MAIGIITHTKLWNVFTDKVSNEVDILAVRQACSNAEDLLTRIPDTFPTYTLHDGTHCKNVCDIIFDLLGDKVSQLTGLEASFLVLSAFYHDIGMVYTNEEKDYLLESYDFMKFRKSQRYADDRIKANNGKISDEIAEWFFRSIHPQRMQQVPDLIIEGISIKQELMALCKSHGNQVSKIFNDAELVAFPQESADLIFCAVLLRIADILDFDQSRSPEVLYEYLNLKDANTAKYEVSRREFLKHKGALGFTFPKERSNGYKIRFNAQCESIEIEHDIRSFLDVINKELQDCANQLSKYKTRWDNLILPLSVDVKDSYGLNYQYGQYLFTIEKDKAIELFTGEKLYSDKALFVRELLQNAIDTTLHRQLYEKYHHESSYTPEVNITTWTDNDNYQWIRIDDNGMGMDERKIREYFLKIANSYYTSSEFEDEIKLYEEKRMGAFTPISRFGIGIISCFLAGDIIEISTRTHNSKSIRLNMREANEYFTMQLEEKGHNAAPMPSSSKENSTGFRNIPGTSIAVRIAPYQHFEELNFDWIVKEHICFPPVSVIFNGKKFITENELCADVNDVNTLKYPLPEEIVRKIEQKYRITIHENPFIKIDFFNLENFVSARNKGLLKGALFLMDACIHYTDDFCQENNIVFDEDFHQKNEGYYRGEPIQRLKFYARLEFDRIKIGIYEEYSILMNILTTFNLSQNEKDWLENHKAECSHRSIIHDDAIDIDADMNSLRWFNKYIKEHPRTMTAKFYDLPFADDLLRSQLFAHNGIVFFDGGRFKDPNITLFELLQFECVPIVLFRDVFRPELNISREIVQSIPLEMLSELNLAFRKAFGKFRPHWYIDRDKEAFHNRGNGKGNALYQDILTDDSFRSILKIRYTGIRPIHTITAKEIFELNNFDSEGGWCDYFDLQASNIEQTSRDDNFLNRETLTDVIYAAWIQKNYNLKLSKQREYEYVMVLESGAVDYSSVIYDYYPPLFFLQVDDEDSLLVRHNSRGFINFHHPDSKKIVAMTKTLHNNYPALFRAFKDNVCRGFFSGPQQDDVLEKIKKLPLWKNF